MHNVTDAMKDPRGPDLLGSRCGERACGIMQSDAGKMVVQEATVDEYFKTFRSHSSKKIAALTCL